MSIKINLLNQRRIYQLISSELWTDILDILYKNKEDISNDSILKQTVTVFELAFFKKVKTYDIQRKDIRDNLDVLYLLNHGKFHQLTNENYKTLIIEIVKRKPLKKAIMYARQFPEEDICKTTISKFELLERKNTAVKPTYSVVIPINWLEINNRLFELINNNRNVATYYSGLRFINTVREFQPNFPVYKQFIKRRELEGKSVQRKIFFYDILLEMNEEMRIKIVVRILETLKPYQADRVEKITELLGGNVTFGEVKTIPKIGGVPLRHPKVFISYSWDDEHHKEWVLNLADRLCSNGIDVLFDRYELKLGKNLPHFVEDSIAKADRIIIVFTPNYKLKADNREGGVGYEYSIMNSDLYNNQIYNEKVIPVLRSGNKEISIPHFMQQFIHIDIRNDKNFENCYIELIREIYNEYAIQKPELGDKPIFEKRTIEVAVKAKNRKEKERLDGTSIVEKMQNKIVQGVIGFFEENPNDVEMN